MKFLIALIATIAVTKAEMATNAEAYGCIEKLVNAQTGCAVEQCVTDGKQLTGEAVQSAIDSCAGDQKGSCAGIDLEAAKECAHDHADNSTILSTGLLFIVAALAF